MLPQLPRDLWGKKQRRKQQNGDAFGHALFRESPNPSTERHLWELFFLAWMTSLFANPYQWQAPFRQAVPTGHRAVALT